MPEIELEAPPQIAQRQKPPSSTNRNINDIYWRKGPYDKDVGWIIVGPGLETAQALRWQKKGREPLLHYSYTDEVSVKTGRRETIDVSNGARDRTRYYWFIRNGGAKEFPVDQIVAYNWHISPPFGIKDSFEVFPQLRDYELPEPLWCPLCSPDAPNRNSPSQLTRHLIIQHGIRSQEVNDLLAKAKERPIAEGSIIRQKNGTKQEKNLEAFPCEVCGQSFRVKIALFGHMRTHGYASPPAASGGQEKLDAPA